MILNGSTMSLLLNGSTDSFDAISNYLSERKRAKPQRGTTRRAKAASNDCFTPFPTHSLRSSCRSTSQLTRSRKSLFGLTRRELSLTADFIMTLMSVHWDQGRKDLDNFCRSRKPTTDGGPFNWFSSPNQINYYGSQWALDIGEHASSTPTNYSAGRTRNE